MRILFFKTSFIVNISVKHAKILRSPAHPNNAGSFLIGGPGRIFKIECGKTPCFPAFLDNKLPG